MARSRERGTGSVYLPEDPKNPGQILGRLPELTRPAASPRTGG
jgi:hypothetical protein